MNSEAQPDKLAVLIAEEILRAIYGDDFSGCTVSLDSIASIVHEGIKEHSSQNSELLATYEKLVEAIHVLSTPPATSKLPAPDELRTLLSERLDAINGITAKILKTSAALKAQRSGQNEI